MAKVCSNCGAQIQDGVKFCGKCGQKVPVETSEPKVCPNCGASIQDGVKFCGKCGQKIQVKQTIEPQRQDTAPQQRQDTAPQQRQDTAPQQRQDTAPPQRQDSVPPQRQDTEPPQQNQISADEAKENIKNFFSGGFQSAVEKFSALSLKNKAICVAVVVIALSMLFGHSGSKYLGMDVQTFVEEYNASLNNEKIKAISGLGSVNRDELKIIGIEQKSNGQINFKLNGAPIQVFNCQTANGYLATIQLWTSSSDRPEAFVVAMHNVFLVMEAHKKLNYAKVQGEWVKHGLDKFELKDSGINIRYSCNNHSGVAIFLGDENYKR